MKPLRFLPYVHHQSRAIITLLGMLVLYLMWLWLLGLLGLIDKNTSPPKFATLLLVPLAPITIFDLWLRVSWQQETPSIHPPPPNLLERLFYPEYGLYWFPVLIKVPLWVWATVLIGWSVVLWLR